MIWDWFKNVFVLENEQKTQRKVCFCSVSTANINTRLRLQCIVGRSTEVISGQWSPWQPQPLPVSDPAATEPNLRGDVFPSCGSKRVSKIEEIRSCFCVGRTGLMQYKHCTESRPHFCMNVGSEIAIGCGLAVDTMQGGCGCALQGINFLLTGPFQTQTQTNEPPWTSEWKTSFSETVKGFIVWFKHVLCILQTQLHPETVTVVPLDLSHKHFMYMHFWLIQEHLKYKTKHRWIFSSAIL